MNLSDFTPSLLSHEFAFATSPNDGVHGDDQEICGGAWSLGKSSMPVSKIPDSGGRYYSEDYYYNSYYYAGNGNINAVPSRDTGLTMCVPSPLVTAEPDFAEYASVNGAAFADQCSNAGCNQDGFT